MLQNNVVKHNEKRNINAAKVCEEERPEQANQNSVIATITEPALRLEITDRAYCRDNEWHMMATVLEENNNYEDFCDEFNVFIRNSQNEDAKPRTIFIRLMVPAGTMESLTKIWQRSFAVFRITWVKSDQAPRTIIISCSLTKSDIIERAVVPYVPRPRIFRY